MCFGYEIEYHYVNTSEGWKLCIKRYKPSKAHPYPVILCHGLGANSNSLDFDGDNQGKDWEKYSLAHYLLYKKFDIWVVDLRGRRNLKGVIAIASPAKFENLTNEWRWLIEMIKIFHPRRISFPIRWIKVFEAFDLIEKFKENVANLENVREDILDKYIKIGWCIKFKEFCSYPRYPWLSDIFYKWPFGRAFMPYSYARNLNKFRREIER